MEFGECGRQGAVDAGDEWNPRGRSEEAAGRAKIADRDQQRHHGCQRRAREGDGPTLLEIKTYRYKGHSISDPQKYRSKDEVEEYKAKDPLEIVLKTIQDNQFATTEEIKAINDRVDHMVNESVKFAEESPWPDDSEVLKDVYVDPNYPFIVD
jgi:pyruvate dehydrogenase E1 component alpha subunit